MKQQKHQPIKSIKDFMASFTHAHDKPRPNQKIVLDKMPVYEKLMVQAPTGTGKTALGYSFLKTHCGKNENGFYVCPSKTLVDQVVTQYPEITAMYGRNEYPCLYYDSKHQANEIPCAILKECPHRVDLETGETRERGVKPCSYLLAKYKSRQSALVACTSAYYFFEALQREELPHAVVVDEVHKWANSIRSIMQYQISDHTLEEFWILLTSIECFTEAKQVRLFCDTMIRIVTQYRPGKRTSLIVDKDLRELLKIVLKIQRSNIDYKIKKAISDKKIDVKKDRELLKQLDDFTGSLYKYVKSLEFALESKEQKPLSYVFGFWDKEIQEGKKAQYVLTIKSYAISGLTKTRLLPEKHLSMSATIGADSKILSQETGIDGEFIDLVSDFPINNTRIFVPNDVENLSVKGMRRNDKNRTLRKILHEVKKASRQGIRSLVIVVSEDERKKFMKFAEEEKVLAVSYDEITKPREAIKIFREGLGDVLVGTEMQYGEGIDLPNGIAQFTFYLRPGYPSPDDPQAQFEEKRFGNQRWALWTWRVITKMLQARGRTIRSIDDKGCIFLMSSQFKRFTFGGLPKWLQSAYSSENSFDKYITEGIKLIKK